MTLHTCQQCGKGGECFLAGSLLHAAVQRVDRQPRRLRQPPQQRGVQVHVGARQKVHNRLIPGVLLRSEVLWLQTELVVQKHVFLQAHHDVDTALARPLAEAKQ